MCGGWVRWQLFAGGGGGGSVCPTTHRRSPLHPQRPLPCQRWRGFTFRASRTAKFGGCSASLMVWDGAQRMRTVQSSVSDPGRTHSVPEKGTCSTRRRARSAHSHRHVSFPEDVPHEVRHWMVKREGGPESGPRIALDKCTGASVHSKTWGGGVWNPEVCVPKSIFPFVKFYFSLYEVWDPGGRSRRGGNPPSSYGCQSF